MKYLTVDFGSTFTKLTAIDTNVSAIVGTSSAFTTIETDVMLGFRAAMEKLTSSIGSFEYDKILCCSSAAGGLKMIAVGLVPELTAKAAKMAASSAGAKVVKTYSFEISKQEQQEIYDINPDLVLLCGGTDGGNKEVIIANAQRLCAIDRSFSVIAAGNKSASYDLEEIFTKANKDFVITDNVMPTFNRLNITPAKNAIRDLFIKKIIDAKGLSQAQALAANQIVPTPLAVMTACELLSKGTRTTQGMGELMAIDLGGATTDVYSMATGKPRVENIVEKGLPEPFSKRTVEGDLGMRYSLKALTDELSMMDFALEIGLPQTDIEAWITQCISHPDTIAPSDSTEQFIEEAIAQKAIAMAVNRHCGIMESAFTPLGEIFSITGKDLTEIPYVIGIGGALINSANPAKILSGATYDKKNYQSMKPKHPKYLLDEKYIFASMGLLSIEEPELALKLMINQLRLIH